MMSNILYSKPKTQPSMGKNDRRVGVRNSTNTLETVKTSARTANGGKIQALSRPPLRKLLTRLSITQMIILVFSSATLGAFVNANVRHWTCIVADLPNIQVYRWE